MPDEPSAAPSKPMEMSAGHIPSADQPLLPAYDLEKWRDELALPSPGLITR
jgi:hypothetical protein